MAAHAVEVAVEELGVAVAAQQDEGVGEGLEEALDGRGDGLARLGVVVHDEGDGVVGLGLDEGAVEDGAQVPPLRRRQAREAVQQRRVEEGELVRHVGQVRRQPGRLADPELADEEELVPAELLFEVRHEGVEEVLAKVLHRVEAEAAEPELAHDPLAPRRHVLLHLRVRVVDVGEHEEVGVARLLVDRARPVLVVAHDAEDAVLVVARVVVGPAEVLPAVFLRAVLARASGKVEADPRLDLVRFANVLCPVFARG